MKKAIVWRVRTGDGNYRGQNDDYILLGPTAAAVEAKAIELAKERDKDLIKGEPRHAPYVRTIERIGEVDG